MNREIMIGVDIGTTSTKAVAFDGNGKALVTDYQYYPLITEQEGQAEQELEDLFQAVIKSVRGVMIAGKFTSEEIQCVSFSSAMHSLILMDKMNQPMTKCITWADNRSELWVKKWKLEGLSQSIYEETGTPIHPMSPFAKIGYFKEYKPELFQRVGKFIGIKEYVFFRLFGTYEIDYGSASGTGMFDIRKFIWSRRVLDILGISEEQLSVPVSPTGIKTG